MRPNTGAACVCRDLDDHERMRREYARAFEVLEELNPAEVEAEPE